jgi:hypothetical protein
MAENFQSFMTGEMRNAALLGNAGLPTRLPLARVIRASGGR